MSGWVDVEEPGGPEGLADSALNQNQAIRVDEVTGDTPGNEASQEYKDTPVNDDVPIAVIVKDKETWASDRMVTGNTYIPENASVQILGESRKRRLATLKAICTATDGTDYVLIAEEPSDAEGIGYRIDHAAPENFGTQSAISARAVGGAATVYWYVEEDV